MEILKRFKMEHCRLMATPMLSNEKIDSLDLELVEP